MLDIHGQHLLHRLTRSINDARVQSMTAVANSKADAVLLSNVVMTEDTTRQGTGEAVALACARARSNGPAIFRLEN